MLQVVEETLGSVFSSLFPGKPTSGTDGDAAINLWILERAGLVREEDERRGQGEHGRQRGDIEDMEDMEDTEDMGVVDMHPLTKVAGRITLWVD